MRNDIYPNLLKIALNMTNSHSEASLIRATIRDPHNDLSLTIKNYHSHKGLSKFIHNDVASGCREVYEIKGPMGLGISLKQSGRHIAYTAGTGVLPFIDLVAHLLIRIIEENGGPTILNCSKDYDHSVQDNQSISDIEVLNSNEITSSDDNPTTNVPIDLTTFSFELHTSFATVDEAIGLELIENLELLCHKFKLPDLFVHHSRIAVENHYTKLDEETFKKNFTNFE